jgi:hypothetical protein
MGGEGLAKRERTVMNLHNPRYLLLFIIAPLVTGAAIYVSCRNVNQLLIAQWLPLLSLFPTEPMITVTPWVKFQLPDGLWLFSFLNLQYWIWRGMNRFEARFWWGTILSLALSSELFQLTGTLPGTYDPWDVFTYLATFCISIILAHFHPLYHSNHSHS